MTRTRSILGMLALVTLHLACAPPDEDIGEVTANIMLTAPDVRCLILKAVGTTTVTTQADVDGPMSAPLTLTGLSTGSNTFTASAYAVKCASAATATYVSDPITATVVAGSPLTLNFKMRSTTANTATATIDFPEAKGRTSEFQTWAGSGWMNSIFAAPDGNLWIADTYDFQIISPAGWMIESRPVFNTYTGSNHRIDYAAVGPDDAIWFSGPDYIGRTTVNGAVKTFSVPTQYGSVLTAGPDGNMWFTDSVHGRIGKITPFGVVTFYPTSNTVSDIVGGPDGNLWFTNEWGNKIGKITPSGTITEYNIPTAGARPAGIAVGGDGNLWFTERYTDKIGKITTAGVITEYSSLAITVSWMPYRITRGADGNLWVTASVGIAKVTTSGTITLYPAGTDTTSPQAIAAGPDGNIWFTEDPLVGRVTP
jgi:streptogramin lyase